MRSYSDVVLQNQIPQDQFTGSCRLDGDAVYIPEASGKIENGKVSLSATLERYTLFTMNHQTVLMRDNALKAFQKDGSLYDYGILMPKLPGADRYSNSKT